MSRSQGRKASKRGPSRVLMVIGFFAVLIAGGYVAYSLFESDATVPGKQPEQTEGTSPSGAASGGNNTSADTGQSDNDETGSEGDNQQTPAQLLEAGVTDADIAKTYDIVIAGGRVINPETKLDQEGLNIGISGGTIGVVTAKPLQGKRVIDAKGLVVSPGFIDNLSYDPNPLGVWQKIGDGVTSNIAMHGGTVYTKQMVQLL